ncbi:MAG: hypothetical protein HQM12_21475 [SAR324 cluster bacterium]|nr:hypothetical protein [SAR324 cluster bacterium]
MRNTFLKALTPFLERRGISQIPDRIEPIPHERFFHFIEDSVLKHLLDNHYLQSVGVGEDDSESLLSTINTIFKKWIERQAPRNTLSLNYHNLLAVSSNAAIIFLNDEVLKCPLDEFLGIMMASEVVNHRTVYAIWEEWNASAQVPERLRGKLGIPCPHLQEQGGFYMEYVGRSLDMLILQQILTSFYPQIDQLLHAFKLPQNSLDSLNPSQLLLIGNATLEYNFPVLTENRLARGEWLSLMISCATPCVTREHYDALNAFLDYAWENGFMYRDKIVDNLTLHKGKLYLIDFGVADTFDPQRPPNPASYQKHREEKINAQLLPFIIPSA